MSKLSLGRDDQGPVLMYDGEPIAPDSSVTAPARAIAELAFEGVKRGVAVGMDARDRDPRETVRTILRTVARDERGRVTHVVEEGPL